MTRVHALSGTIGRRALRDLGAWLSMLALVLLADRSYYTPRGFNWPALGQLVGYLLLPAAVGIYVNHLVLVPRLFDQGRYLGYGLALLLWSQLLGGALYLTGTDFYQHQPWFQLGISLLMVQLLALAFLMTWRAVQQRRHRLQAQLAERELQLRLLEAQVNPHFLFNTLNSLYALSLTGSPRTPDMILELSGLMRYQLGNTLRSMVPLADELAYLRSYVSLQQMRLGPRCPVTLELPGQEPPAQLQLPPLLFLALVENAFTYGTRRAQGSFVHLALSWHEREVHLLIRNSLPPATDATPPSTGTGLVNTRQRLDLLYPGRHQLQAAPDPATATFVTHLTLSL